MAVLLRCPNCRAIIPQDQRGPQPLTPEPPGAVIRRLRDEPPSPPGEYEFRGRPCRYDYNRVFPYFGTVPDAELARLISHPSRKAISRIRRRTGISRCRVRQFAVLDPLLGTRPDADLARRVGLHPDTVALRRRRLGIGPYRGSVHAKRDAGDALLRAFAERAGLY